MKEICANADKFDALFLDINKYSALMPCYVIYSKLVRLSGIIVLANHCSKKFVEDLRSGYVDGYQHDIRDCGSGINYEIKQEHGA